MLETTSHAHKFLEPELIDQVEDYCHETLPASLQALADRETRGIASASHELIE